jgi:hypothetical protein
MIDDREIVRMYQNESPMKKITAASGLTKKMVYKRLRINGVEPNRKVTPKWSQIEEQQLIEARKANVTGQELCDHIPTRTLAAIKGHIAKLRARSVGEFR